MSQADLENLAIEAEAEDKEQAKTGEYIPGQDGPPTGSAQASASVGEILAGNIFMLSGLLEKVRGPHWKLNPDMLKEWADSYDKAFPDQAVSPQMNFYLTTGALFAAPVAVEVVGFFEGRKASNQEPENTGGNDGDKPE